MKMTMDKFKEEVISKVHSVMQRSEPSKAKLSEIRKSAAFEDYTDEELICIAATSWFERATELIEEYLQKMWEQEEE